MASLCRRLLAAFALILIAALLRAQDAADRLPLLSPHWEMSPDSMAGEQTRPPVFVPPQQVPITSEIPVFDQMSRVAGIIFSGRVTSISRASGFSRQDGAATAVTFQVEHAMRGASPGESLTIREWAGLWSAGEHYRVGERVMLFLYAPSKLGLTSPVAGPIGRFAIGARGTITMGPQHIVNFTDDPILGGKTVVRYSDIELAVQRSRREE